MGLLAAIFERRMLQNRTEMRSETPDRIDDLDTPCLLLDRGRVDANVARMNAHLAVHRVAFRPHLKTAK
jgi:D-serine deaminase-like pyridoxal phosphate-dependent protein